MKEIGLSKANFRSVILQPEADKIGKTTRWRGKYLVSYGKNDSGAAEWKIVRLNFFERAARYVFGKLGAFKSTHRTTIQSNLYGEENISWGNDHKIDVKATIQNIKQGLTQQPPTPPSTGPTPTPTGPTGAPIPPPTGALPPPTGPSGPGAPPPTGGLQGLSGTIYVFDQPTKPQNFRAGTIGQALYSGLAQPGQITQTAKPITPTITSSTGNLADPKGNQIFITFGGNTANLVQPFEDAFYTMWGEKVDRPDGSKVFIIPASIRNAFLKQLNFQPPPLPQYTAPTNLNTKGGLAKAIVHRISPGEEGNTPNVNFVGNNVEIKFQGNSFHQIPLFERLSGSPQFSTPTSQDNASRTFTVDKNSLFQALQSSAVPTSPQSQQTAQFTKVSDGIMIPYTAPQNPNSPSDSEVQRIINELAGSTKTTCQFSGSDLKITFDPSEVNSDVTRFQDVFGTIPWAQDPTNPNTYTIASNDALALRQKIGFTA